MRRRLTRAPRAAAPLAAAIAWLALAATAGGCASVGYVSQAARGQLSLSWNARKLEKAVADEKVPARTRALLSQVPAVKKFGEQHGLKATRNYESFVHLDRPSVVWVVSACEPLKFKPRQWSFPLVGSFTYLGWFDEQRARKHGEELEREGLDVYVRGASAYSTLGWFRDSVLSTMISGGPEALGDLVNVVLHESVHATFHVAGQSSFNESLASFVGDRLALEYLATRHGTTSMEYGAYAASEEWRARVTRVFHDAWQQLDRLYSSDRPDAEKLEEKKRILADAGQRAGLKRTLNNATLIQYRTYDTGHAEFQKLLDACGASWPRFWKAIRTLGKKSFPGPQQEEFAEVLRPLIESGCGEQPPAASRAGGPEAPSPTESASPAR